MSNYPDGTLVETVLTAHRAIQKRLATMVLVAVVIACCATGLALAAFSMALIVITR